MICERVMTLVLAVMFLLFYGFDLADCIEKWPYMNGSSKFFRLLMVIWMGLLAMGWSMITYKVWVS